MRRWVYLHIIVVAIALIAANIECMTRCVGGASPAKTAPCHGGASGEDNAPSGCKSPVLVAATDLTKFAPAADNLNWSLPAHRTLTLRPEIDKTIRAIDASPPLPRELQLSVILRI